MVEKEKGKKEGRWVRSRKGSKFEGDGKDRRGEEREREGEMQKEE